MAFADKVVLITGASSGIGAKCAEHYAKEGAKLALVGRNAEKFENVIEQIRESGVELEPLVILADVSVDAERIISETIEKYGRLDVLINNAGFMIPGQFETMEMADFDAQMATNLRGAIEITKYAIPYLTESLGNIINVSSCLGLIASFTTIAYSMSKAALNHFTKCLAIDLAPRGIRVNAICPGCIIDTDFHHYLGPDRDAEEFVAASEIAAQRHPMQRNGLTEDCVNAISFLTKDSASFLTGILMRVDGGLSTKSVV